jgi:hypothetical protein
LQLNATSLRSPHLSHSYASAPEHRDFLSTPITHPRVQIFHDGVRHVGYIGDQGVPPECARANFEKVKAMALRGPDWVRMLYDRRTDVS